jgi:geranylgeranyl pyrophosphate synthase
MVRRHRPTLNSRASNSRAVLAGDFLLAQALKELCANPSNGPTRTLISGLSQVLEDMVSGEWLQLEARGVVEVSAHHLDEVARKKTASLLAWCCSVGPVLAELSDSLVLRLRELGIHLGIAFQQVDDVLDFQVGGEKPFAQDIREGLVNRVGFELIRANPSLAEPLRRTIALWRHSSAEVALQSPWPWQEKELEAARHVVRLSAQAHIEAARELWNGVISELSLERSNPSVQAIYRILDELPGRRK